MNKDRAYNYGIAGLLILAVLIALGALYAAHQPDPLIATLPLSPTSNKEASDVASADPNVVPPLSDAPLEPDHAAYPVDPREPNAEISKQAGLREGETKAAILLVAVEADDRVSTIDIEHTSGSLVTDGAAIDYARALHWTSSRNAGKKSTSVLRYVVRFQR